MTLTIEASLTHEEIMEILSKYITDKTGRSIEKYNMYVTEGYSGERGGKSTPSTARIVFKLTE